MADMTVLEAVANSVWVQVPSRPPNFSLWPGGGMADTTDSKSVAQALWVRLPPRLPIYGRVAQLIRASRLHREGRGFESLRDYQFIWPYGGMVDTTDLKSVARKGVSVRVRLRLPKIIL